MTLKFKLINGLLMTFFISGFMTFYVSWINLGFISGFVNGWLKAWVMAYPVAFVAVWLFAPIANKLTTRIINN